MTIDGTEPLSELMRQEILDANSEMAQSALRVLAFAYRVHEGEDQTGAESGMTFVGLMGMIDPPVRKPATPSPCARMPVSGQS
jgi:Ca2+-transporting ATPase